MTGRPEYRASADSAHGGVRWQAALCGVLLAGAAYLLAAAPASLCDSMQLTAADAEAAASESEAPLRERIAGSEHARRDALLSAANGLLPQPAQSARSRVQTRGAGAVHMRGLGAAVGGMRKGSAAGAAQRLKASRAERHPPCRRSAKHLPRSDSGDPDVTA